MLLTLTEGRHLNNDTIRALHLAIFRCAGLTYSFVESKWCDYVMVEADSHLKLLPTSISDLCKVFEHIDMLSTGIQYQPYIFIPTLLLGSDFGVRGHLWSQNDVICHGWGCQPTQPASHIHIRGIKSVWAHWYAVHWHMVAAYSFIYLAQILGIWVTCGVKMMSLCHGWGWQPPQTASHIHIRHAHSVWAHWYADHRHMVAALHIIPTLLGSDFGAPLGHLWSQNDVIMS